jgi:ABC-type multidrug transport system ATPase subunit
MHTAQHLVRHALTGPLAKDRTILLVTHHISLCLPHASYLIELSKGKVAHQGTVQELRDQGVLQQVVDAEDIVEEEPENISDTPATENEADLVDSKANGKPSRQLTDGKLVEAEARAEGRVSLHSYLTYIRASGVLCSVLTLWLLIQIRLINIGVQVTR